MKRCPSCNRTYDDEALNFCLTDGTVLVIDESVSGSLDPASPAPAPPPATDWSAPAAQAVPSSPAWSAAVGNPPVAPTPSWGTGYPQTPPGGGYMVQKKEQGLAIGALVCGVLGLLCCSVFTGIPAIVLGLMAMNKEKSDPARYTGKGMAIAGIALGSVSILFFLLYIILMLAGAIDLR